MSDNDRWMDLCLGLARAAEAEGRNPVAAVIVRDGVELGRGTNEVPTRKDPTLHAEVSAIRDAVARHGTETFPGATLYSTMEPCPMCAWAIRVAGIEHVVLGARLANLGRKDMGTYSIEALMAMASKTTVVTSGVREQECTTLRRDWMQRTGRVN